jgi:hypothetical protein
MLMLLHLGLLGGEHDLVNKHAEVTEDVARKICSLHKTFSSLGCVEGSE